MQQINLKNLSLEELTALVLELGGKAYRARQIFRWIHHNGAVDLEQMANLPQKLKRRLAERGSIAGLALDNVLTSQDGTQKLLFSTDDGKRLETVLIPMPSGLTQCVSSQIGCHIGCPYCLTGKMPDRRNLTVAEIIDQVYQARRLLAESGDEVRNLVFMGMGEPLHNFKNVVAALKLLMHQQGANFSSRRITVSTSGLVHKIDQLGQEVPVNLAISLNAVTDELRDRMVPINKKFKLAQLIAALHRYPLPPRRRITLEYVVCKGVNDTLEEARLMVKLVHGLRVKINLIPFNPYPGAEFETPDPDRVRQFQRILLKAGHPTSIRMHKGRDIGAACGQLDGKPESVIRKLPLADPALSGHS